MKKSLVTAYRELAAMNLMGQSSGNVSCRVDGGMLISCSGSTAQNLTAERLVEVRDNGSWDGNLRPSSEWRMHQAIYQCHEGANAVVHTHSDYCVAMACNNLSLPGFHYMVGTFGGSDVPCIPYATFGTEPLAQGAAQALINRAACLLGNHGMICRGRDLATAVAHAERLETLCRHYVLARQVGEPDLLTQEQWQAFFERAKLVPYSEVT